MSTFAQTMMRVIRRSGQTDVSVVTPDQPEQERAQVDGPAVEIAPNDPLVAFLQSAGGPVEVDKLDLDDKAMPALVGFTLTSNRLARATFTATYSRK